MRTLVAVGILLVLGWYLPFWSHTVTANERWHIRHASEYIEQFRAANSRLPSGDEFRAWEKQEDIHGANYDGWGYALSEDCYPLKAIIRFGVHGSRPYCLAYWTGDVWVTYWSPQGSDDVVVIDDSGGIALVVILFGILLFGLTRSKPRAK
jgi:hypothetical protein